MGTHSQTHAKACVRAEQWIKCFGSAGTTTGGNGTSKCDAPRARGISHHMCKKCTPEKTAHPLENACLWGEATSRGLSKNTYVQHQALTATPHSSMKPSLQKQAEPLDTLSHASSATAAAQGSQLLTASKMPQPSTDNVLNSKQARPACAPSIHSKLDNTLSMAPPLTCKVVFAHVVCARVNMQASQTSSSACIFTQVQAPQIEQDLPKSLPKSCFPCRHSLGAKILCHSKMYDPALAKASLASEIALHPAAIPTLLHHT